MATELTFDPIRLPPECQALRAEVRAFLAKEIEAGTFSPDPGGIDGTYSEEFSRKVGAKGWIGMTWPKKYGGREKSFLERFVVTEEFRIANAPVRLHFVADRRAGRC
jgi:alkylation response protein AidB-like acyl-CoA dehydrogenase